MFGVSTGEVLVVLSLLGLLAATYGAQRRHRNLGRGPYRAAPPRGPVRDPWRWYRLANRALLVLPVAALLSLFRLPARPVLILFGAGWFGALAVAGTFRCPRCRRAFGGSARRCRSCGLGRYRTP